VKRSGLATIRSLRYDEPLPEGEPRRYRSGSGYVRLRWKVAPNTYVEEYEHRIVAGRPHPRFHVHHKNEIKHDNRPENLEVLTAEEHLRHHRANAERRYAPYRSKFAKYKAERAERNRQARAERDRRVASLYADGLTTVEIGRQIGLDASGVTRILQRCGVRVRSKAEHAEGRGRRLVGARSSGRCEVRVDDICTGRASEWQHRKNRSQGGGWAASNGLHACSACHGYIHANPTISYSKGWMVRSYLTSSDVPVMHGLHGHVFLDDAGGWRPVEFTEVLESWGKAQSGPFEPGVA
jgi:hypothetical protein